MKEHAVAREYRFTMFAARARPVDCSFSLATGSLKFARIARSDRYRGDRGAHRVTEPSH